MLSWNLTSLLLCVVCASILFGQTHSQATPCPVGFFNNNRTSNCEMCPLGSVSSSVGATSCSPCHSGYFAPAPAMSACLQCTPGTFSAPVSNVTMANVPESSNNSSSITRGSSSCSLCRRGSFSKAGAAVCTDCPAGSYSNEEGLPYCRSCERGTFQATIGASSCLVCPLNSAAPITGMSSCHACSNSSFTNWDTGFGRCVSCPLGQTLTVVNQTTGERDCISCPSHTTCSRDAGVVADAGYWMAGPFDVYPCLSEAVCIGNGQCGPNRVQPASDNFLCETCEPGYLSRREQCIACDEIQISLVLTVLIFLVFFTAVCQVAASFLVRSSEDNAERRVKVAGLMLTTMLFVQSLALVTSSESLDYLSPLRIFLFDVTSFSACVVPMSPEMYTASGFILIAIWLATNVVAALLVHVRHQSFDVSVWFRGGSTVQEADQPNADKQQANSKDGTLQQHTPMTEEPCSSSSALSSHSSQPTPNIALPRQRPLSSMESHVLRTKFALVIGMLLVQNPIVFNSFNSSACVEYRSIVRSKLVSQLDCESSQFSGLLSAYLAFYNVVVYGIPLLLILGYRLKWACLDWAKILYRGRSIYPLLDLYAYNMVISTLTQLWYSDQFFCGKFACLIGVVVYRLLLSNARPQFRLDYLNRALSTQLTYLTILLLLLLGLGPHYSSTAQIIIVVAVYIPFVFMPFLKGQEPKTKPRSLRLKDATSLSSSTAPTRTSSIESQSSSSSDQLVSVAVEPSHTAVTSSLPEHTGDFEIEDTLSGAHTVRT